MTEYNAKDDGEGSYLAAIEAKRLRGDTHYPSKPCKYGDPVCPCQDGDPCHYEGKNPMRPPVPTTCLETAYGTTVRLSFQIKVF